MNAITQPALLAPPEGHAMGLRLAQACTLRPIDALPEGLDAIANTWIGRIRRVLGGDAGRLAQDAQSAVEVCQMLNDAPTEVLRERLLKARESLSLSPVHAKGRLAVILGTIGQMALRELGMQPYKVQYMGALALHRGLLAEMATGEGKTLTVALAGVLAGLSGRPCHVLTANDYLAGRDADVMRPLYAACGVSVTAVTSEMQHEERPVHYASDVVYLTAKEVLADHLRDELSRRSGSDVRRLAFLQWLTPGGLAQGGHGLVQVRGLHTAIVDEADSILIDDAVTPLILSAPRESGGLADAVRRISRLADEMQRGEDYQLTVRAQTAVLTEAGKLKLERVARELPKVWRPAPRREELMRQALVVRHFFHAGEHYLVQDGEVVLLDGATGRMTPGRSLSAGLHQAIEAFEGLEISDPSESLTQMSFQGFFRRFRRLSGCTGTALEAADELWSVYGLTVVRIPTHRPRIVHEREPIFCESSAARWQLICDEVLAEQAAGRPVLVGVRSVPASETLAELLRARGCQPAVLNALSHAQEAEIVAGAGQPGMVTIATNMAGRGTDIQLAQVVVAGGGLHVIIAEPNDSPRVDRQLAGRCGRQGDPGSVSRYLCPQDSVVQRFLLPVHRIALEKLRNAAARTRNRWAMRIVRGAQRRAEHEAFERRISVLRSDDWQESALPFGLGGERSTR